jgi:hypothetical protein
MNEEEYNDASSNPFADEHLPVGGEIVEPDEQIDEEVLEDLDAERTTDQDEEATTSS